MMLNSRFELSKIEKNTRVEREIFLATLKNREWKENLFLPLSKIESRKRIVSCHSRKSRVEREMGTIKFSRSREKFLFLLSIFLSRARLLSMPAWQPLRCIVRTHRTGTKSNLSERFRTMFSRRFTEGKKMRGTQFISSAWGNFNFVQ